MEDVPLSGVDCNGTGEDDLIDIFAGTSLDEEGNGVPDECDVPCGGDADCDDGNDCTMDVCDLAIGVCAFNSVSCLTDADCPAGTCNPSTGLCSCLCGDACQLYGDVDGGLGDCDVDVDDLLYVLDGFSDPASFPAADIEPCGGGDGDVDVDDLLAELDAFSGIYACPHPCP